MKRATLKIKNKIESIDITNNSMEMRRVLLRAMLFTLGGLCLIYLILLISTVWNIVERRAYEGASLALSNQVSDLEVSYLNVSNSVDMKLSAAMGFKETTPTFAARQTVGSLKVASNEI